MRKLHEDDYPHLAYSAVRGGPKKVKMDAKRSFRNGVAVLSVYVFRLSSGHRSMMQERLIAERFTVPRDTPKAEINAVLRATCELVAIRMGCEYQLRSKLQ
jgi:hypothetical protein